ncbi:hypothetical protein ACHAWO_013356 [Cyclotella atomus]|uniref:EXS domain-containing protein n=1 Tax=Cyclotella atomus TaxID=382360 RepID=A0ABD3P4Y8_9STRA
MLMPIIAAVGSFVVSERILKPKATALVLLACLALYDLFIAPPQPVNYKYIFSNHTNITTDTHNYPTPDEFANEYTQEEDDLATSMRCYRGPGLIAIALFCSAYSLRVWRRNGVACDELIFLPGTPHECRLDKDKNKSGGGNDAQDDVIEMQSSPAMNSGIMRRSGSNNLGMSHVNKSTSGESLAGTRFAEGDAAAGAATSGHIFHLPSHEELEENNEERERSPLMMSSSWESVQESPLSNEPRESPIISLALKGLDMLVVSERLERLRPPLYSEDSTRERLPSGELVPIRENEVYDAEYAPSGPSVLGAALDLSLPVLFNFHMFCVLMKDHYRKEAEGHTESDAPSETNDKIDLKVDESFFTPPELPPTVLPLIFLSSALIRSQIPRKQRQRFFKTILQGTAFAIFRPVRFRDAFVGDCITSLVRPIVDVVFAFTYYCVAVYGFVSQTFGLEESRSIVSNSKLMHGLLLPLVAILPLWYRFLQTLKQAYDSGKRWPYLGNALKYFTAGLVVLYGMTHSTGDRGYWWVVSFVATTIYQIIWDSCMDWELLVFASPNESQQTESSSRFSWCSNFHCPSIVSSWSPRWFPSRLVGLLVSCRRITTQPIINLCQRMSRISRIRLRSQRMYDDESYYWRALFVNASLRFCWMMGFIPAYRISIMDGTVQETFSQSNSWTFVILATLEIVRCCIWGIIKVELETIKLANGNDNDMTSASIADEYLREGRWHVWKTHEEVNADEMAENDPTASNRRYRWLGISVNRGFLKWVYLLELSLWPIAFVLIGYYVVATDFD